MRLDSGDAGVGSLTAADGGSARFDEIDVEFLLQSQHLGGGEAGVGEHAVLVIC